MPLRYFLTTFITLCFISCGTTDATPPPPPPTPLTSLSLYLSRASLTSTDFEQYKVVGRQLFRECGLIRRGRHVPQEQDVVTLYEGERERLSGAAWQALYAVKQAGSELDEPGDNSDLFDPGQVTLEVEFENESVVIKTALDGVSKASGRPEREILNLIKTIRGLSGGPRCRKEFYGVGAATS